MCPDWGSNRQPFVVWDDAPMNLATRPGLHVFFFMGKNLMVFILFPEVEDPKFI